MISGFVQDTNIHILVGWKENDLFVFSEGVKGSKEVVWYPSGFGPSAMEVLAKDMLVLFYYGL